MIEVVLCHDGSNWIVRHDAFTASGESLDELDLKVEQVLREHELFRGTGIREVAMRFDNATIPMWIRQYMPHYFNRTIKVRT